MAGHTFKSAATAVLVSLIPACSCACAQDARQIVAAIMAMQSMKVVQCEELRLETDSLYLGVMTEDDPTVEKTLSIANTGDSTLVFTGLEPSCGCVRAAISRKFLEPGDTAEVSVAYAPKDQAGEIDRYVDIYTAGYGDRPSARVRLYGTVLPTSDPWDNYRAVLGPDIRARRSSVKISLSSGEMEKHVPVVNVSSGSIRLHAGPGTDWLRVFTVPEMLGSGEEGELVLSVTGTPPFISEYTVPLVSDFPDSMSGYTSLRIIIVE